MNVLQALTNEEIAIAHKIRRLVFVDEQHVPLTEEIDSYESEAAHFILYDGELPIGAGRLRFLGEEAKVERVCVLKQHRKSGAGKILMTEIENFARKRQINTCVLHAQTHAIPFYLKLNYTVTSEEFLDAGIPHQEMKKTL